MFKKIVLAYDGASHCSGALQQAAKLARLCNAELHVLGVVAITGSIALAGAYGSGDFFGMERTAIEGALESAVNELGDNLSVHARVREGEPARQIAAYAHEVAADLVIIGHSDKGLLARWFEGSTGARLIRDLPCDLLVATSN